MATPIFRSRFVAPYPAEVADDTTITWSWSRALLWAVVPGLGAMLRILDVDRTVSLVAVIATAVVLFSGVALYNLACKHKSEHGPS